MRGPGQLLRRPSIGCAVVAACLLSSCARSDTFLPAVDLIAGLKQAERRPASAVFNVTEVTTAGASMRAIETEALSRITWDVSIPPGAILKTALALRPEAWTREGNGILFRIGIAEGRTYEELVTRQVDPFHRVEDRGWIPVSVDLSRYGGFKWSIFYQPARLTWRIIFNTNFGPPYTADPPVVAPVWGEPMIHARRR